MRLRAAINALRTYLQARRFGDGPLWALHVAASKGYLLTHMAERGHEECHRKLIEAAQG